MSYAITYANRQRDPRRHLGGILFVIILHALLAYALKNGLARDVINAFKNPLEVHLIEEVKPIVEPPPPPPPPEVKKIVARPEAAPPPSVYAPPPEVLIETPQTAPTISVVQQEPPPPEPPAFAAPAPVPVAAAVGAVCPNHLDIRSSVPYPSQALRFNKSGEVLVEFVVETNGAIDNIRIVRSSDPVFNRAVIDAVKRFRCAGQSSPALVRVPFQFALN
ncbi:MAG: TonB family protein [Zoogloeaceae bacterium]|nr:TonB family protein [Zoogloeaceae bacterium]